MEELYGFGHQELEWQGEKAAFSDLGYRQKREPFFFFFFDNLQFIEKTKHYKQRGKSSLHTASRTGGRLSLLKQKDILESKAALAV